MPDPSVSRLYQPAVLWTAAGADAYGQKKVHPPIEIRVRWNTARTEALTAEGTTITLDATAIVPHKIEPGSLMWLGELVDWYGTGSGSMWPPDELMEVKMYQEVPDMKNRYAHRNIGMMRYREGLPNLVS